MDTETDQQQEETKLREGMMLRYRPQSGRADRLASNIPGGSTSTMGANADHMAGVASN